MINYGYKFSNYRQHNGPFDEDEAAVIAIHGGGDREETIDALRNLKASLERDKLLLGITGSALQKLEKLSDAEWDALDVHPSWLTGEEAVLNGSP